MSDIWSSVVSRSRKSVGSIFPRASFEDRSPSTGRGLDIPQRGVGTALLGPDARDIHRLTKSSYAWT